MARGSGWAQTHKGKANYGSFGVGSSSHLFDRRRDADRAAKTPAPVLARLEKETRAVVQGAAMKARFQAFGLVGMGNSSAEFKKNLDASGPVIQKLVMVSGAKVD